MCSAGQRKPFGISPRALARNADGRYLFVRRSGLSRHYAGKWEPPGGKMDVGETVDVTLEREVAEETGLRIRDLHVVGATEGETEYARFVALMMEAVAEPGEVKLSDEHDAFMWVTPVEAVQLDLSPIYTAFIQSWAASKKLRQEESP
jgi:8-oxo-dGTP diphosphatase